MVPRNLILSGSVLQRAKGSTNKSRCEKEKVAARIQTLEEGLRVKRRFGSKADVKKSCRTYRRQKERR